MRAERLDFSRLTWAGTALPSPWPQAWRNFEALNWRLEGSLVWPSSSCSTPSCHLGAGSFPHPWAGLNSWPLAYASSFACTIHGIFTEGQSLPICQDLVQVLLAALPSQKMQGCQFRPWKTSERKSDVFSQTGVLVDLFWEMGQASLEQVNFPLRFPLKEGLVCLENKNTEIHESRLIPPDE